MIYMYDRWMMSHCPYHNKVIREMNKGRDWGYMLLCDCLLSWKFSKRSIHVLDLNDIYDLKSRIMLYVYMWMNWLSYKCDLCHVKHDNMWINMYETQWCESEFKDPLTIWRDYVRVKTRWLCTEIMSGLKFAGFVWRFHPS